MTVPFNPHIPGGKQSLIQCIAIKSSRPKIEGPLPPHQMKAKGLDTSIGRFWCGPPRRGKGALLWKIHTSKEGGIRLKGRIGRGGGGGVGWSKLESLCKVRQLTAKRKNVMGNQDANQTCLKKVEMVTGVLKTRNSSKRDSQP